MKLITISRNDAEIAGIAAPHGIVLLQDVNRGLGLDWKVEWFDLIASGQLDALRAWYGAGGAEKLGALPAVPYEEAVYAPLYRHPRKIWGIGFNYVKGEEELETVDRSVEPVGFMKPDTALIGPDHPIRLPAQSERVIAEAELAIVIGKRCKDVSEEEAEQYVAGFVPVFDIAADDIHQRNPRYLTRAKSFDTFFSLGGELMTTDEFGDILDIEVEAVLNGEVLHRNVLRNMRFRPWYTVSFHSKVMTLLPGDVMMTGTPGAVVIQDGDVVECRIQGFAPLKNPVVRAVGRSVASAVNAGSAANVRAGAAASEIRA